MATKVNINKKDNDILNYLKSQKFFSSPTEIGLHFGKSYNNASSWACFSLKKLVQVGKVKKIGRKYSAIV